MSDHGAQADAAATLQRVAAARALLAPTPDPVLADAVRLTRLALHPSEAREVERDAQYRADGFRAHTSRKTGWRKNAPKCPTCDGWIYGHGGTCRTCDVSGSRY
jgi:hypothetical protein